MPVAIVTGSDTGIGKATAIVLAERGWDVGITYRSNEDGAEQTAADVRAAGREASICQLDLGEVPASAAAIDTLADRLGGLDALVNNAGMLQQVPFLELDFDDWQRQLTVDLSGAFACSQRAARRMVEAGRGGSIVNVSSVHEQVPLEGFTAYSPAKGGVELLTKQMALELAPHGIRVNSVAPGEIATQMGAGEVDEVQTLERPTIPLGRPGHAREIGTSVAWLVSGDASYTTGITLVCDGGLLLMAAQQNA